MYNITQSSHFTLSTYGPYCGEGILYSDFLKTRPWPVWNPTIILYSFKPNFEIQVTFKISLQSHVGILEPCTIQNIDTAPHLRGMGLMQGVEMVKDRNSKEPAPQEVNFLFEETRQRGLLIGKGGYYGNVLRIAPPLTAREEHVDEALEILDHAFAQVQEMSL